MEIKAMDTNNKNSFEGFDLYSTKLKTNTKVCS